MKKDKNKSVLSRADFAAMTQVGETSGAIAKEESKIINNLLNFEKMNVRDIMTPRLVIFSAQEDMTVEEFFESHASKPFSRILIYGQNRDEIKSYVLKNDLLIALARDEFSRKLSEFKRDFLVVSDQLSASDIYDRLMHEKSHISLVVDEYGTVQGLVTLEDVVETLIGLEIVDESDTVEDMQELANKRWRARMDEFGIDPDHISKS
jgi:CBS domain containing-hemolysin-like protein